MNKKKIMYAITVEDIINISDKKNISVEEKDLFFLSDKIGDYFGDKWQDAIEYALERLNKD